MAAGGSAGTLYVNIAARTAALEQGLNSARGQIAGFVAGGNKALMGLGAGLAGFASFNSITRYLGDAVDRIDKLGERAERLGTSTEALGGLEHAAKLSGVEIGTLNTGLAKFQNLLGDAMLGNKSALTPLKQLGLDAKDLLGLPIDQQLGRIADRFAAIENPATRTQVSMDLFGRSGANLIPLLGEGSAALEKFRKELDQLGGTVNSEDAKRVMLFNDQLDRLKTALGGAWQGLVIDISPAAVNAIDNLATSLGLDIGGNPFGANMNMLTDKQFGALGVDLNRALERGATWGELDELFARHGFQPAERTAWDRMRGIDARQQRREQYIAAYNESAERRNKEATRPKIIPGGTLADPQVQKTIEEFKNFGRKVQQQLGAVDFGWGLNQLTGAMSGNLLKRALGAVKIGGDGASAMDRDQAFAMHRSDSVESYRQRRAIDRQNNPLIDINKKQENHLAAIRKSNETIAAKLVVTEPANLT